MTEISPRSLDAAYAALTFVGDRTPDTPDAELAAAFAELFAYRDGGVFIGHYAGDSQWERHARGDEIVYVVDGATTLYQLGDDGERACALAAGDMVIVPRDTWHRFETPDGVKILTVTPQPTDHSRDRPA